MEDGQVKNLQVNTIHTSPGDMIVLRYENANITQAEAHAMWTYVKDKFPENPVIFMPKNMEIESVDRDKIMGFIKSIKKECGLADE